jgi:hypothetical protein
MLNKIFFIDLNHADPFDYKFDVITKIDIFEVYMNITQIHEVGLRFAIYYSKSHWKRNSFLIVISCINVKIKGLELMSKIIIYLKRRRKKDRRVLTRYPQDQNKSNLNSRKSSFQSEEIDA